MNRIDLTRIIDRYSDRIVRFFSDRWGPEKKRAWSPYGHEKARKDLIATRRLQIGMLVIFLTFGYGVFLNLTLDEATQINQGSQLEIDTFNEVKPVTVTVTPGRGPAFATAQPDTPDAQNSPGPRYPPPSAFVEWVERLLPLVAPLILIFVIASKLGTSARGKLAELNLGVYKGAMPYEMHVAGKTRARVLTHREVDANVFGKERTDYLFGTYLDEPPQAVRNLLGNKEKDVAKVTRLRRSGAARKGRVAGTTAT